MHRTVGAHGLFGLRRAGEGVADSNHGVVWGPDSFGRPKTHP